MLEDAPLARRIRKYTFHECSKWIIQLANQVSRPKALRLRHVGLNEESDLLRRSGNMSGFNSMNYEYYHITNNEQPTQNKLNLPERFTGVQLNAYE